MNKKIFHGNWLEIKGKLKEKWAKLTDDDLLKIEANHDEIYGILEKYEGYTKEEIKKLIDDFL